MVYYIYIEEEKFFVNFNERKHQSDIAFCSCFQILTQIVIIVTLFLCSVAYWILMTDQVNTSYYWFKLSSSSKNQVLKKLEIFNINYIRQVQKSDRINSDRQSGSDQLGSTRIVSDHEKNIKLNEIETFTHLKVKSPVKSGPN